MKTFILILFFGMITNAKTTFEVSIANGAAISNQIIAIEENIKMHPIKTGSKKNLCKMMKNDEKSFTIYCRSYPKKPTGPKDKNYVEITQLAMCETSENTNLGLRDHDTDESILIKVSCVKEKT